MLNWVNRFNICCFLDNNHYQSPLNTVECLAGAGALHSINASAGNALAELETFRLKHTDWLFGHLGYDLKNETENLTSSLPDKNGFPDLFFFVPEIVIELNLSSIAIGVFDSTHEAVYKDILSTRLSSEKATQGSIKVAQRYSREEYISTVEALKQHILRGDCYEINLCQEFFAEEAKIDPIAAYIALNAGSPNPFSGFYKIDTQYLICASPERYIRKKGREVISQPIKGTWKRDLGNDDNDRRNRQLLESSIKDRSENVMVVDLVRNDLSRVCEEGSVVVTELFKVYSFPQVYQMISTVQGVLVTPASIEDLIKATFPMGSMTGAPKRRVLELIEKYERSRRGIFSGALGYINPAGDCDFNVVIRSLMYNSNTGYLSFPAGSAITFYSDAQAEYDECLLKAATIRNILEKQKDGE